MLVRATNSLFSKVVLNDGASSVGDTATVPEVKSSVLAWATSLTFTPKVCGVLISPVNARVSVAVGLPGFGTETDEISILGIIVTNSKLSLDAGLVNEVLVNCNVSVALFRPDSVSEDGLVEAMTTDGLAISIVNVKELVSLPARFESESLTVIITELVPYAVGVPQIVRGVVPVQPLLPSAS